MNFIKLIQSFFGDKSSRDMKLIQPFVEQVKLAYEEALGTLDATHKAPRNPGLPREEH